MVLSNQGVQVNTYTQFDGNVGKQNVFNEFEIGLQV
jgi:hypothetical protein